MEHNDGFTWALCIPICVSPVYLPDCATADRKQELQDTYETSRSIRLAVSDSQGSTGAVVRGAEYIGRPGRRRIALLCAPAAVFEVMGTGTVQWYT